MRSGITTDEIIGQFEAVYENDEKIASLKAQEKQLSADSKDLFKTAAEDMETTVSALKEGYKYWKKAKDGGASDNEDAYTIMAMIDQAIEEDGE